MAVLGIFSFFGIVILVIFIMLEENLFEKIKQWIFQPAKSKNSLILEKMKQDLFNGKITLIDIHLELKRQTEEAINERKKQEQKEKIKLRKQKLNKIFKNN